MHAPLLLGPLLGLERGGYYTVCFLAEGALPGPPAVQLAGSPAVPCIAIGTTPTGTVWRAEFQVPAQAAAQAPTYSVVTPAGVRLTDRNAADAWTFYVPAVGEPARAAYAACNGFSSPDLAVKLARPYALWDKLRLEHERAPFALLLMGGDQLYADAVLGLPEVSDWAEMTEEQMRDFVPAPPLIAKLDAFYDRLYRERWAEPTMARLLATVPSVMMWDDHDIVDGWGSHDDVPQGTPLYAEIYRAARKYFGLHQLRGAALNRSRLDPTAAHCALGFDFAEFHLLAMDHRSERTLTQVMSEQQHRAVKAWLTAVPAPVPGAIPRPVLALSAIPLVYRSFAALESTMEATPWTEEATDDVRDHWMAAQHRGERTRLLKNLFSCAAPVWVLSGDVHVGALGAVHDAKQSFQPTMARSGLAASGAARGGPSSSRMRWAKSCRTMIWSSTRATRAGFSGRVAG